MQTDTLQAGHISNDTPDLWSSLIVAVAAMSRKHIRQAFELGYGVQDFQCTSIEGDGLLTSFGIRKAKRTADACGFSPRDAPSASA